MSTITPFQFNQDQYKQTKDIYIEILNSLGVENPESFLEDKLSHIDNAHRNGLMFNKIVESLFENDEDRRAKASKALEKAKEDPEVPKSPYVIGYLAEMSDKSIPFDTVLTSAIVVGKGCSLQMGCGEGKTGVLSMAAYAILQNDDRQVFLTSSTPILAEEALDKLKFYDNVGMADKVSLITPNGIKKAKINEENGKMLLDDNGEPVIEEISFEGKTEKEIKSLLLEAYKSPLVSSDNATLMQHAMKGYLPKPDKNCKRDLLADEADFILLDSYRPLQQIEELSEGEREEALVLREKAYEVLKDVIREDNIFVMDDVNQYVDFTDHGTERIVEKVSQLNLDESIDKNQFYDYIYDALVVETVYQENRDYQILDDGDTIVSEDRASGVCIGLPEGVKQSLEIKLKKENKYKGKISPEKKVTDTLNVQSFFKEYFDGRKHFVSGTLGIDSDEIVKELFENFNVSKDEGDIYEAPPKGKGIRDDRGKEMFSNNSEKHNAIINNALEEIEKNRPVLIGTISEQEILSLQKEIANRNLGAKAPRVLVYTAASEHVFARDKKNLSDEEFDQKYGVKKETYKNYSSLIKNESGKENTITIGTSIIGRGTTIKTDEDINNNGGIHVIIDGLHPTSSRNQEQFKARTARGTNRGSTIEFFSLEDIPKEYRKPYENTTVYNADDVYKEVYQQIDKRTSNIRKNVVELVEYTRAQLGTVNQCGELTKQEEEEVKSLICARAFSIKNRACGVSNKFENKERQYKREIEAYTHMYSARYIEGNQNFDEKKWLAANGYEDIAKKYFPFSKKREDKIFTLAGIKEHAGKARQTGVNKTTKETQQTTGVNETTKETQQTTGVNEANSEGVR